MDTIFSKLKNKGWMDLVEILISTAAIGLFLFIMVVIILSFGGGRI